MAVFRPSSARPFGVPGFGAVARTDGDAAMVLPDSGERRTARDGAPHRAIRARWAARARGPVFELGGTGGRAAAHARRLPAHRHAVLAAVRDSVCVDGGCGHGGTRARRGRGGGYFREPDPILRGAVDACEPGASPRSGAQGGRGAAERVPAGTGLPAEPPARHGVRREAVHPRGLRGIRAGDRPRPDRRGE